MNRLENEQIKLLNDRIKDIEKHGYWRNHSMKTTYVKTIFVILSISDKTDIDLTDMDLYTYIYKELKLYPSYLKQCIDSKLVLNLFSNEEIEKARKLIFDYTSNIDEIKKQIRKKEEEEFILDAKKIILEFVNNHYTSINDYCKQNHVPNSFFEKSLSIIKKYDNDLFQKYIECINDKTYFNDKWNDIINKLKNGIKIDDENTRQFDIIDYYQIINMPLNKFFSVAKKDKKVEDIILFNAFIKKNEMLGLDLGKSGFSQIYDTKIEINLKKDIDGTPIPNTGRVVTLQEKEFIVNYLKNNNIPLYYKFYIVALKRYLNDTLIVDQLTTKKKVYK